MTSAHRVGDQATEDSRGAIPLGRTAWRSALALAAAVLMALIVVMSIDPGAPWAQAVGDVTITSAAVLATVACVSAARRGGQAARAWAVMAVATAVYGIAMGIWATYGFTRDHAYPFPSLADAGFLGYAVPAAVALVLFPRNGDRLVSRARVVLDGLVIACSVLFVSWATVLGALYSAGGSGLTRIVGLAYPTVDVVVASLVLALGVRAGAGARLPWLLLGGGWLTLAVTDSVYVSLVFHGETGLTGTVLAAGWVAPFLLIALATRTPVPSGRFAARGNFTITQELLPHVPVLAAILVSARTNVLDDGHPFLLGMGAVLVTLLVLHLVMVALEKVILANGLESAVARRTAELADVARRSQLILNSAGDGIYGVDAEERITFANTAAIGMLGYHLDEMLGHRSHVLLHETKADGVHHQQESCPVTAAIRTGVVQHSLHDRFQRKDGTVLEVEKIASPIHQDERVTGAVVTFRDITKRREVERMKDEFTSVVSHELRTPLTSIRGSLGLLASGALGAMPDKAERMLDIAVSNTDRLVRLINDILDIERIESGTIAMQPGRANADDLMTRASDAMGAMADEAGVKVVVTPVGADLWADSDRIMQLLTNLLSNAIKFSPRGGTVALSAERRGEEVLFSVADAGRGIPEDKMEAVFERFQQVDSSDARDKGGTGLGLPICRSIVEQHSGLIWVTSTVGQGSTFFFTLPALATVGAVPAPLPNGAPAVLVCDDDPGVLEIVSTLLAARGYRPVRATCGQEALALAVREQPAAILLDLLMPGWSGWQTAARLREHPDTRHIPVVICSALNATETDVPADLELAGWLDKPVDEDSVVHALQTALRGRGADALGISRVLVVEDDEDLARVLVAMFERHGIQTFHAASGGEALTISQRVLPDLLVMDLMLPDTDGFAVVDWLRRHDRLHAVHLVIYTAQDLDEADRARLRLGQTQFATKGRISPQDFERLVTGLLARMTVEEASSAR